MGTECCEHTHGSEGLASVKSMCRAAARSGTGPVTRLGRGQRSQPSPTMALQQGFHYSGRYRPLCSTWRSHICRGGLEEFRGQAGRDPWAKLQRSKHPDPKKCARTGMCPAPMCPGQRSWGVSVLGDYTGPYQTAVGVLLSSDVTATPHHFRLPEYPPLGHPPGAAGTPAGSQTRPPGRAECARAGQKLQARSGGRTMLQLPTF